MNFVIEAPFNLGLKEPRPGKDPGARLLPEALNAADFSRRLQITDKVRIEAPEYISVIDQGNGIRNASQVIAYTRKLSAELSIQFSRHKSPLVIGGDCSILLGIMLSLKKRGNYGLFFIDGHTDFITLEQSTTAAIAGMDLAIVAGLGHESLTNIDGCRPYVKEEAIFCFGNREYDELYEAPIKNSRVSYYHLNKIRQEGIGHVTGRFLSMVDANQLDGFWIHLDVDVLDDTVMPCVDSRNPGGLSYDELRQTITALVNSPKFAGLDITILDPTMDTDGAVVRRFANEMVAILNQGNTL
jgi:arginase